MNVDEIRSSSAASPLPRPARATVFILLLLTALTIAYPLFLVTITSIRTNADYLRAPFGWPQEFTLDAFIRIFDTFGAGRAFINSLYVVSLSTAIAMSLAILGGYALAKYPVPGARYITATFVAVMLIPGQVLIIPIYLLLSKVQLVGTHPGLMVVYIATALPFAIFFLSLSFKAIPSEVLEAAKIDGAGFFRTLWSVVLPMSVSSIATLAVLQFLGMWNELIFAYILLPDQELGLLTPLLARASGTSKFVSDQTVVSAGLLLTASVPLLLLAIASRYIMKGLSVGFSR